MKLVDILARDLKIWPEGISAITQGLNTGMLRDENFDEIKGAGYLKIAEDSGFHRSISTPNAAIITRAQWQAAVDALKTKKEKIMAIDWSKAPKDFPLWLEGTNEDHCKHSGWYRERGAVYEGAAGGQWRAWREGQFFTVHRKPESDAWTGEGLPPVGATVEIHRGKWNIRIDSECFLGIPVTVAAAFKMGSGTEMIAVDGGPSIGCEVFRAECARPIRTPEHIAAEVRSKACDAIYGVLTGPAVERKGNTSDMAEALYDAGYRKFEITDE